MAGTVMHRSKIPIQEWFWSVYLVATHTPGISAKQLQRQLGISNYETAWYLLQRLRKGMVNGNRAPLDGLIEADETIIGGPAKGMKGRGVTQGVHNSLVIGAVEVMPYVDKKGVGKERAGRLRLDLIDHADEKTIREFLKINVAAGASVRTDGWRGYSRTAYRDTNIPLRYRDHLSMLTSWLPISTEYFKPQDMVTRNTPWC